MHAERTILDIFSVSYSIAAVLAEEYKWDISLLHLVKMEKFSLLFVCFHERSCGLDYPVGRCSCARLDKDALLSQLPPFRRSPAFPPTLLLSLLQVHV